MVYDGTRCLTTEEIQAFMNIYAEESPERELILQHLKSCTKCDDACEEELDRQMAIECEDLDLLDDWDF